MKVAFLVHNAFGIGGTVRSTANLSSALADRHDVEVVSVHRVADRPALAFDRRVGLTSLVDMREDSDTFEGDHELAARPNTMFPDKGVDFGRLRYTALHDDRLAGYLRRTDADVVIATRPILAGYLARHGHPRYLRIGQEHLSFDAHSEQLRADQNRAIAAGLDAFVTVSEADAARYRSALPEVRATITCVPNAVPEPAVDQATLDTKLIVAAGRLVAVKRYDRLIDAFSKVAAEHPDWTLRIYGRGPEKAALRRRIEHLHLYNQAFLMGPASPIETEWAKGAIAAVSSDMESFGMTIVEAMHCGVPVVATDCPHGPGEIISHGRDGRLVPLDGGADAYAEALHTLITDSEQRHRLGAAARATASGYAPSVIAERYERLFHTLSRRGRPLLTRVRRALSVFPRSWGTRTEPAAEGPSAPLAHVRASAGGVSIALDPATLPPGPLDVALRLRRDPERREVRVPVRASDGSVPTVSLDPRSLVLAEGRWDCYVIPRTAGRRRRIEARLVQQARLLPPSPPADGEGLAVCVPYTTVDGYLALRAWRRPSHAEVEEVLVGDRATTITATLLGDPADDQPDAAMSAVRRGGAQALTAPAHSLGRRRFRCSLAHDALLAARHTERDLWDLRLSFPDGDVSLGRLTGDIVDRKKTDLLPPRDFPDQDGGTTRIKPYFTLSNDLAVSVRALRTGTEAATQPAPGV